MEDMNKDTKNYWKVDMKNDMKEVDKKTIVEVIEKKTYMKVEK